MYWFLMTHEIRDRYLNKNLSTYILSMDVWKSPFSETRQVQHKSTLLSNYRDQHFKVCWFK